MGATIALLLMGLAEVPAHAAAQPQKVILAWLPSDTTVEQLAKAGLSPGVMSAGLGTVPPQQTYLDVGQGNRVFDSLYDRPLPELRGDPSRWWGEVVDRAESAPADIDPGLLQATLAPAGLRSRFSEVRGASLDRLPPRRSYDLLIAIAGPTGKSDEPLPIGIAGRGFDGDLTSDSTRMDGYVLSTDVAPTILRRFGVRGAAAVSGEAIPAGGRGGGAGGGGRARGRGARPVGRGWASPPPPAPRGWAGPSRSAARRRCAPRRHGAAVRRGGGYACLGSAS